MLLALLALNYLIPVGAIGFESRAVESIFYAVLMFSPILCAGLLFGSAIKRSTSLSRDYGTNLLGAMVGGVGEYLSLVTGFRALLLAHRALLHRGDRGKAEGVTLAICPAHFAVTNLESQRAPRGGDAQRRVPDASSVARASVLVHAGLRPAFGS